MIRGWVRELGFRRKPRLRAGFGARRAARANAIGRLLPQPTVATLDGRVRPLDDVLGPGFAVLGLGADPRAGLAPGIVAAWERLNPRWLTVRPVEEPLSHEGEIADVDQTLVPLMRRFGAIYVAVRPDRYLFDAGRHTIAPPWAKLQPQPEDGEAATDRPPSLVTS